MSNWEYIPISHEEFVSGKWADCTGVSGKWKARVWYDDKGQISPSSYSDAYCKEHGLGKYAEKKDDEDAKKERRESKKSGDKKGCSGFCCLCKCLWRCFWKVFCCFLPFGLNAYFDSKSDE